MFNVPSVVENIAVVVLQSVGARSDYFGYHIGSFAGWRELVFFLHRLGPSEHEIADFEYPSSDLPFMVPVEGLLIASGADDGYLEGLFEQVNCVLLGLRCSVAVESCYSWCTMVEVRGQHGFCSVSQEKRRESCGSVWGRS